MDDISPQTERKPARGLSDNAIVSFRSNRSVSEDDDVFENFRAISFS